MKKAIFPIMLLCIIAAAVVYSCKKTNNATGPSTSLNQIFSGLRTIPQSLAITAGRDTVVFGSTDSTMLHFYSNSFKDGNGNAITSGTIDLQLVEMYKPGEMICNRTTTITSDTILTSGGEISLIATMNGQTVYANKYGIGFQQQGASTQTMELYYGNNANADSTTTWTEGNVILGDVANGTTDDSGIVGYNYYFFDSCVGFNTVNCDYFWSRLNGAQITDVNVIVPNANYNGNNTEIFLMFPTDKVSVPIGLYNAATNTFSINYHGNQIPVGLNYELVVITNNDGSYYYFEQSGVTTMGMTVNAALAPETEGDILARLAGL